MSKNRGKEYKVAPKERMKKVFNAVVEGVTMKKAMIDAGYSPISATVPISLTKTKGWKMLLEQRVRDDKLINVLNEGLDATKQQGIGGMAIGVNEGEVGSVGHIDIFVPDYAVRHKYLETGLKLKGHYPKDSPTTAVQVNINRFKDYE